MWLPRRAIAAMQSLQLTASRLVEPGNINLKEYQH